MLTNGCRGARGIAARRRKTREAERLFLRAIAGYKRAYGPQHVEVGFNVGQLAALYHSEGRVAEARRLYRRAIDAQTKALGPEHPVVATTKANFAAL